MQIASQLHVHTTSDEICGQWHSFIIQTQIASQLTLLLNVNNIYCCHLGNDFKSTYLFTQPIPGLAPNVYPRRHMQGAYIFDFGFIV